MADQTKMGFIQQGYLLINGRGVHPLNSHLIATLLYQNIINYIAAIHLVLLFAESCIDIIFKAPFLSLPFNTLFTCNSSNHFIFANKYLTAAQDSTPLGTI